MFRTKCFARTLREVKPCRTNKERIESKAQQTRDLFKKVTFDLEFLEDLFSETKIFGLTIRKATPSQTKKELSQKLNRQETYSRKSLLTWNSWKIYLQKQNSLV